jgi:hypothetical protein
LIFVSPEQVLAIQFVKNCRFLQNPKFRFRVCKTAQFNVIPRGLLQLKSSQNVSGRCVLFSSGLCFSPAVSLLDVRKQISRPLRAVFPMHLVVFGSITVKMSFEQYRLLGSFCLKSTIF